MSTTNPAKPTVQRHDARRRVVVASVPSGHVYVRHLAPVSPMATEIVRLPDPTSPWWPPSALDPEWIRAHADAFDLMHVHFGFDSLTPAQLMAVTEALRGAGKPLVLTVHDLRNPHHVTRQLHDDQLDVLVRAADAVLTLTDGAAREIRRRWGRWAWVVPHPHVVELDLLRDREQHHHAQARAVGNDFLIGVHLKSLRACMAGPPVVDALLDIARSEPGVRLRLDAHCDVALADGARFDPGLGASLDRAERAGADVRVHDYFSDADLWEYLASLDLSVLPYQFGTHSGWLEACRDLGTAVAAPRCGYYADQGASVSFELSEKGLDVESLARAIRQARLAGAPPPLSVDFRAAQRDEIARVHASTYLELLS